MDQRRRYRRPPIEEALCEFHFTAGPDWNLTVPGKLQTELQGEYSGTPREQRAVEVGLDVQGGKPANLQYGEGLARVQLVTEDETRMVGVGRDLLSIHMLNPYQTPAYPESSGWEEFKPRISAALEAYWRVAAPIAVRRVGVRYINKIVIPEPKVNVEEYLRCALPEVDELPERLGSFMTRIEYLYADDVRLVLSHGTIGAPTDHVAFVLDLDVIWEGGDPIGKDTAMIVAEDLRVRERTAFEATITDKAREIFDAD